jgi:hypothetical protein
MLLLLLLRATCGLPDSTLMGRLGCIIIITGITIRRLEDISGPIQAIQNNQRVVVFHFCYREC